MSKQTPAGRLPLRPDLEWYRRAAKKRLKGLRAGQPAAKLADAQLAVAREAGFASWRKLKDRIDSIALQNAFDDDDGETLAKLLAGNPALAKASGFTWTHPSGERRPMPPMIIAACLRKNLDMVRALIAAGVDVNTPAVYADGRPDIMAALLDAGMNPNAITQPENCPGLMYAAFIDDLPNARLLLARGADARAALPNCGSTALHWLNWRPEKKRAEETIELANLLARAGADVNARTFSGLDAEPITDAGNLYLVEHGGATPLHWAAAQGNEPLVKTLLDLGADRSIRTVSRLKSKTHRTPRRWTFEKTAGDTPATLAAEKGHADLAALLYAGLSAGTARHLSADAAGSARPTELPPHRRTHKIAQWKPIMDAAYLGDAAAVAKLLDAGADPNVISSTPHRQRPLHRAIERKKSAPRGEKHLAVVKTLLTRGADPHLRGTHGLHTALQLAAIDSPQFVPLLRERFVPLDFWHAVVMLDAPRVKALLKKDASLASKRDENEWLPLHYCAASALFKAGPAEAKAQATIAAMLIDAGADVNGTFTFGGEWPISVLFYACGYHDNPRLTEQLIRAGANPCDQESVYHASDEQHTACLNVIERLTDAKKLAKECTRCLATQLYFGHTAGAPWLLAHGANPNTLHPKFGRSALHAAANNGASAGVIDLLLRHGGDPRIKTADGFTAIDLAKRRGKTRVLKQLGG